MSSEPPRKFSLMPYAPSAAGPVRALEVHVGFAETGMLSLRYVLDGDLDRIRIPPPRAARQTDELWKHTCFEAFIQPRDGAAYHELNFSPSTEWAAYSFESYRKGMVAANLPRAPEIHLHRCAQGLELSVQVQLEMSVREVEANGRRELEATMRRELEGTVRTESGPVPRSAALALAAVIEGADGRLSYWALKHPAEKPDFHHPDSFALEL